jgi:hypothetical protein
MRTLPIYKNPFWVPLTFEGTGKTEGFVLLSYSLIKKEDASAIPLEEIRPPTIPCQLMVFCMGMRDIIPSIDLFPVKKCQIQFDISGDT